MRRIGILDYGVGNVTSLAQAVRRVGAMPVLGVTPTDFANAWAIILPGVGAFDYAMDAIERGGWADYLRTRFVREDVRIVGICLGMQIMFESSEEGAAPGLGALPGSVRSLPDGECHVGWNRAGPPSWDHSEEQGEIYYFNHSYYVDCDADLIEATTAHAVELPAIVKSRNFVGLQFHPEKSQQAGHALLKEVLEV